MSCDRQYDILARMRSRRTIPVLFALLLAAVLSGYVVLHNLFSNVAGQKLVQAKACDNGGESQNAARQNPNKAFFVSCGGFIE